MDSLASEYNAVNYSDEQILERIKEMVDEKVEDLFYSLEEIENVKAYKYPLTEDAEPQTVFKLYRVVSTIDEYYKELVLVIDVEINDNEVQFICYNVESGERASAEFINGEMGSVDGVPTPIQENEFITRDIESLLDNMYSQFCN